MNARDLIADLPLAPGETRQALLYARLLLNYLADHVYVAEPKLRDATDFKAWLRELAEAARMPESTKVSVISPSPQRRWDEFCPDCGHVHADERECGWAIGGGRVCRCERAVSA